MRTGYVHIRGGMLRTTFAPRAEFRIAPSDAWTGRLDIGAYSWNSGEEIMTLTIDRPTVAGLLAAITAAGDGATDFRGEGRYSSRWYSERSKQWSAGATQAPAYFRVFMIAEADRGERGDKPRPPRAGIEIVDGASESAKATDGGCIDGRGLILLAGALETFLDETPA